MATIAFKLADVLKLCTHAKESKAWQMGYDSDLEPAPALQIVGDQGVYLMSNGTPGLPVGSNVVYAKGIHPEQDEDWYDQKRAIFGGDDGADTLTWIEAIEQLVAGNPSAKWLKIEISRDSLGLIGVSTRP